MGHLTRHMAELFEHIHITFIYQVKSNVGLICSPFMDTLIILTLVKLLKLRSSPFSSSATTHYLPPSKSILSPQKLNCTLYVCNTDGLL